MTIHDTTVPILVAWVGALNNAKVIAWRKRLSVITCQFCQKQRYIIRIIRLLL